MTSKPTEFHVWEGLFEGFGEAEVVGEGFAGDTWLNHLEERFQTRVQSNAEDKQPGKHEYLLPMLVATLANDRPTVDVLDFGGGVGATYHTVAAGLSCPGAVTFHIVEGERVCELGRTLLSGNERVQFHTELPSKGNGFDIIHAGSSIQYVDDWKGLLEALAGYGADFLLLSDVPAGNIPTFVTTQVYYQSRIPFRFWNLPELIETVTRFGFRSLYSSRYIATIVGRTGPLPMANFPAKYRLRHACHLLFGRI